MTRAVPDRSHSHHRTDNRGLAVRLCCSDPADADKTTVAAPDKWPQSAYVAESPGTDPRKPARHRPLCLRFHPPLLQITPSICRPIFYDTVVLRCHARL